LLPGAPRASAARAAPEAAAVWIAGLALVFEAFALLTI